jgi:hypothetical protein
MFAGGAGGRSGKGKQATALPGGLERETGRMADMFVSQAEGGGLRDPLMSNVPSYVTAQRHATTNEPPMPEVPANMTRGRTGGAGLGQDSARRRGAAVTKTDVDAHRVMNSFHPPGTRLRPYEWNEGLGEQDGVWSAVA